MPDLERVRRIQSDAHKRLIEAEEYSDPEAIELFREWFGGILWLCGIAEAAAPISESNGIRQIPSFEELQRLAEAFEKGADR